MNKYREILSLPSLSFPDVGGRGGGGISSEKMIYSFKKVVKGTIGAERSDFDYGRTDLVEVAFHLGILIRENILNEMKARKRESIPKRKLKLGEKM